LAGSSVLGATGQTWKLLIGIGALIGGSVAPLSQASGITWTAGTVIAVAGYLFTMLTVRCPGCESRWFWQAALDAGVYAPIFKGSACPSCKKDFSQPHH